MSAATPASGPHARQAEITSQAWAEALSMAGAGPARRPPGELAAAALLAHSALSAGLGRSIPLTGLGPHAGSHGGSVRTLATFLAVYAHEHRHRQPGGAEQRGAQDLGAAQDLGTPDDLGTAA
ncbi:hypothetical protein ACGFNQ_26885 [Streptomyces asoensis]|uniref:hypothetical protein n=1 Tax=Streptomyces asoensis TaxID=249586 RepID=UPI00371F34D7